MHSGVISAVGLRQAGWTRKQLNSALEAGALVRVARGWFARPASASTAVIEAVRHRGRLGCLSACRQHGLWTPDHHEPHIIVGHGSVRMRPAWHRHSGPLPDHAVFPLVESLAQVVQHHSAEEALIVLESAANQGKITPSEAECLIGEATQKEQRLLKYFNPAAQSGSETRVRIWLHQQRVQVRAQVYIPGVGYVDHLVGRSMIVECDSAEFHQYRDEDYRRDMESRQLGYRTVRLGYKQIHYQWDQTRASLLADLRTRRHLQPPRPY